MNMFSNFRSERETERFEEIKERLLNITVGGIEEFALFSRHAPNDINYLLRRVEALEEALSGLLSREEKEELEKKI